MAIATGGLVVNVIGLFVLHGGRDDSLNVRGAWLHVLTDALGSVGTIVAGALVWWMGWQWADPVASIVICALVLYSAWSLLRESVSVLMEGTPRGIDPDAIRTALLRIEGVSDVHDLHVWTITTGFDALSGHLRMDGTRNDRAVLADAVACLKRNFGIEHATLQLEEECVSASVHP